MGDDDVIGTRTKAPVYEVGKVKQPDPREPSEAEIDAINALQTLYAEEGLDRILKVLEDAGVAEAVYAFMTQPRIEAVVPQGCPPSPDFWPQHELHVHKVPRENRKRFFTYVRRRFGVGLREAREAMLTPGYVLLRGKYRHEIEDVLPDMETLGVEAELVIGDDLSE